MALAPKFTAMGSAIASVLIIFDVVQTWRREASQISTRHRVITGMSICDAVSSLAWFMSSWPMPAELTYTIWNVGSFQTCAAQGFFVQFSLGTVAYNFCLAVYYLAVIRYGWTNRRVAQRLEPIMHLFSIGFVFVTNTVALKLKLYNPLSYSCWIASYPYICTQSYETDGESDCLRGDNSRIYLWIFGYGFVCFVGVFLIVSMILVWMKIRRIEQRGSQRRLTGAPQRHQRSFASQALLYVSAFFASWTFGIAAHTYLEVTGTGATYWVSFIALFLVPSQGLFNATVYFASRFRNNDPSQRPQLPTGTSLFSSFRSSFLLREKSKEPNESKEAVENIEEPSTHKDLDGDDPSDSIGVQSPTAISP